MTKRRVAIIHNQITPYRVPLFRAVAEAPDLDVHVIFLSARMPDRTWAVAENLGFAHTVLKGRVLPIPGGRNYAGEPRLVNLNPDLAPALWRLRPEVVVCPEFSLPAITAFLYTRLTASRYISWSEGTPHTERNIGRVQKLVRRWIIPRASACIPVSSSARDKYLSYGADPAHVHVAIQTVDTAFFQKRAAELRPSAPSWRKEHGIEGKLIVSVGSLIERKGMCHLVEALALLHRKLPDVHLALIGGGPLQDDLTRQVEGRGLGAFVHFPGFAQPDDLAQWLAAADVFAFPTLEDTFGVVVNEAMATGLPVVSSIYAGATRDLVHDGENGFAIDPTNYALLADCLYRILSDDALARRMSEASQRIIARNGIEASAAGFLAAIRDALGQRPLSG